MEWSDSHPLPNQLMNHPIILPVVSQTHLRKRSKIYVPTLNLCSFHKKNKFSSPTHWHSILIYYRVSILWEGWTLKKSINQIKKFVIDLRFESMLNKSNIWTLFKKVYYNKLTWFLWVNLQTSIYNKTISSKKVDNQSFPTWHMVELFSTFDLTQIFERKKSSQL